MALVMDVGCGPGHWTEFLQRRGVSAAARRGCPWSRHRPKFVDIARVRIPGVPYRLASLRNLDVPDVSLHGVLAWYSLIHVHPHDLPGVLSEFVRSLTSGGHLLVGFFEGAAALPFDHAATTAYFRSVEQTRYMLNDAGFDVSAVEARQDPGKRAHAANAARRSCSS